ncbi:MAG: hypothetical protein L3J28_02015 [Candidatus Polarisedimenticolaceae bacterium]|nr:hypothetical protein [Candidatus Polarisedimenticolaceae bacterium]
MPETFIIIMIINVLIKLLHQLCFDDLLMHSRHLNASLVNKLGNKMLMIEMPKYERVVIIGLLALLLITLFPQNVSALSIREYTRGSFSFTGSVTLRQIDRRSGNQSSVIKSKSFSTIINNRIKGFVWDPRFMVFTAGLNFRQAENSTGSEVSSRPRSLQYSLYTTWLPKRRNPFVLHMNHSVTTVSSSYAPTYELVSDVLGMRWGLSQRTLGALRFTYGMRKAVSTGESTDREQLDHSFKVIGKRRFKSKRHRVGADLNYGYHFDNKENRVGDSQSSEHRLYINNRTNLTPEIGLTAEGSYFNRLDDRGGRQLSMQSLRASSSLSVRMTEAFNTNYGLSVSASTSDSYDSNSASGSASMNYRISERWNSNASLSITSSSSAAGSGEVASSAAGGLSYGQRWGIYDLSSSYSLGIGSVLSESSDGYTVSHGFGIGLSQSVSPLWRDGISYSFGYSDGKTRTSMSHGLLYRAKSRFSIRDDVELTVNYKQRSDSDSEGDSITGVKVEREASSTSTNVGWTHRLAVYSSLIASAGYAESDNTTSGGPSNENKSKTARLTYNTSPFGLRNLRFRANAKYVERYGSQMDRDKRYDTDFNLDYKLGRWVSSFKYAYSNSSTGGSDDYENQTITIEIQRYFGVRF